MRTSEQHAEDTHIRSLLPDTLAYVLKGFPSISLEECLDNMYIKFCVNAFKINLLFFIKEASIITLQTTELFQSNTIYFIYLFIY